MTTERWADKLDDLYEVPPRVLVIAFLQMEEELAVALTGVPDKLRDFVFSIVPESRVELLTDELKKLDGTSKDEIRDAQQRLLKSINALP